MHTHACAHTHTCRYRRPHPPLFTSPHLSVVIGIPQLAQEVTRNGYIISHVMKISLDLHFHKLSISQIFRFKFAIAGHCIICIHCIIILAATHTLIVSYSQLLICPLTLDSLEIHQRLVVGYSYGIFSSSSRQTWRGLTPWCTGKQHFLNDGTSAGNNILVRAMDFATECDSWAALQVGSHIPKFTRLHNMQSRTLAGNTRSGRITLQEAITGSDCIILLTIVH